MKTLRSLLFIPLVFITLSAAAELFFSGEKLPGSYWGIAVTSNIAITVGPKGSIQIRDSDSTWQQRSLSKPYGLWATAISRDYVILVAGSANGKLVQGDGVILNSTDKGETFSETVQLNDSIVYEISFVNDNIVFAAGTYGGLHKSIDGGVNWQRLNTGTSSHLWAVEFTDLNNGFIGGGNTPWQNNKKSDGIIIRTSDGGNHWKTVYNGSLRISDFSFVSENIGFAAGVGGLLLKTVDSGQTWKPLPRLPLKAIVNAIEFHTEKCGLAVGSGGTAYITTDGGLSWPIAIEVTNGSFLEDLHLLENGKSLVSAGDGTVGEIDLKEACK